MSRPILLAAGAAGVGVVALAAARGAITVDLGVGRRTRPLGPIERVIAAPREVVFDVLAGPYRRTPRAQAGRLRVWERGTDMVLAEHLTPTGPVTTSTLELVRLQRPERLSFRLIRGPVPHVVEAYEMVEAAGGTRLVYSGELGTDLWALGVLWGRVVAPPWERAVAKSLDAAAVEAERRARPRS
jgi:uncharacterized protein YndB with AHSA1/START domain